MKKDKDHFLSLSQKRTKEIDQNLIIDITEIQKTGTTTTNEDEGDTDITAGEITTTDNKNN